MKAHCNISPHSWFTLLTSLIGMAGIPAIWLPFAWGFSPAGVMDWLWLAWSSLLAILISLANMRWIGWGRMSKAEQWGGRLLAAASIIVICLSIADIFLTIAGPTLVWDWVALLITLAVAAIWAFLMFRWWPNNLDTGALEAIALMEVAYLATAIFCLLSFSVPGLDLNFGGYLVLLASVAYAAQATAIIISTPSSATTDSA